MEQNILANAELVRSVARNQLDIIVEYDEAGVRWLDAYINRQRRSVNQEVRDSLPGTLGSFLGECIRHAFGGQWVQDSEQGWMVRINDKLSVYPFNKVAKQLASEDGESVLGLFAAIPVLLDGIPDARTVLVPSLDSVRPWWRFWATGRP